jgi:hypothetical protein
MEWMGWIPLSGEGNAEEKTTFCIVTGIDISMQKTGSCFVFENTLMRLKDNDPKKYDELKKHFLPRRGFSGLHTKYEGNEFTHLAKQIRNSYHNKRQYFDSIPVAQLSFTLS